MRLHLRCRGRLRCTRTLQRRRAAAFPACRRSSEEEIDLAAPAPSPTAQFSRFGTERTASSSGRAIVASICSIGVTPLSTPMMMRGSSSSEDGDRQRPRFVSAHSREQTDEEDDRLGVPGEPVVVGLFRSVLRHGVGHGASVLVRFFFVFFRRRDLSLSFSRGRLHRA